jgi:hypothetical protein
MRSERIEAVENALALEELRLTAFLNDAKEIEASNIHNIRADAARYGALGGSRADMLVEDRQVQTIKEYFEEAVRLRENSMILVPELDNDEFYTALEEKLETIAKSHYQRRLDVLRQAKAGSGETGAIPGTFDAEQNSLVSHARNRVEVLKRTRKLEASVTTTSKEEATAKDPRNVFVV